MMSTRVIVLGAGGFMGRAVWRVLAQDPECAHIAVHFRRPPPSALLADRADMWSALDLVDATPAGIIELIEQSEADVVVNCAGATHGSPDVLRSANIEVAAKVSAALTTLGHGHLIHLGSAAEYGLHRAGEAVTEMTPATPVSDYGVTKLEATRQLLAAGRAGRLTVTVLRVFNPLGRGSAPTTLPGRAAQQIDAAMRRGDDDITLGSLESWRDYIDARDVGGAVAAAMRTVPDGATLLNVARGEAVHSRALIENLAAIAGFKGRIIESDDGSSRSSPVSWQRADISSTTSWLHWQPEHSIEASLQDLWSGVREGVPS
jgi:NDP-hexose 4-ketoreductase